MTLAFVLARIARASGAVSVLDWGGALGHQHAIARAVLPEIEFDWHTRELPEVCREGRLASAAITFHDRDDCFDRRYDLVLASSSLQYLDDWRAHLRRLARATCDSVFLTRVPLVDEHPGFVVIQRAQAYGYATEYLGWVFNRMALLEEAQAAGLELVREFFLQEPMDVVGAPERPSHGAFLFKATAT
jgi:putative methyltransferase (TIGR04325 family)